MRVFFTALRRNDLAAFTSRFRLRKKSTVWPALSTARYRYAHCPPTLYIGLVHPPRSANWPRVAPPALFELWKVPLNPPQDRGMRHSDTPFAHHRYQISKIQLEAQIPAHAQHYNLPVEVASFEQVFERYES